MSKTIRNLIFIVSAAVAICCAGCGGGGGKSSTPLTLSVTSPDLTGKTGEQVNLPVQTNGDGSVTSASFDLHFNSGIFQSTATLSSNTSVAVTGLGDDTACRYKWIDSQTIRVVYASASGTTGGNVLVNIPVKVLSESAPDVTVQQSAINTNN